MTERRKPVGQKGPIVIENGTARWAPIDFPAEKARREWTIAEAFIKAANRVIMYPSKEQPSYAPFGRLEQNPESDLDFTVQTAHGERLLELVEFAPLGERWQRYEDVPGEIDQGTKSDLLVDLLRRKSAHHGGEDRILLVYVTEQGFGIDPITVEITRRRLQQERPRFDRIYYLSPGPEGGGMVWEIFPGSPHPFFQENSDEDLRGRRARFPHPTEFVEVREVVFTMPIPAYGNSTVRFRWLVPIGTAFTPPADRSR